jgi:hypothetical protein
MRVGCGVWESDGQFGAGHDNQTGLPKLSRHF